MTALQLLMGRADTRREYCYVRCSGGRAQDSTKAPRRQGLHRGGVIMGPYIDAAMEVTASSGCRKPIPDALRTFEPG